MSSGAYLTSGRNDCRGGMKISPSALAGREGRCGVMSFISVISDGRRGNSRHLDANHVMRVTLALGHDVSV